MFNEDGSVASRGQQVIYVSTGDKTTEKPNLHVLSIGTSDYAGDKLDLRFAAKDAEDFASAMKLVANEQLFPQSNIQVLSTGEGNTLPTKDNIRAAFEKLQPVSYTHLTLPTTTIV